jgi:hypothetical protein
VEVVGVPRRHRQYCDEVVHELLADVDGLSVVVDWRRSGPALGYHMWFMNPAPIAGFEWNSGTGWSLLLFGPDGRTVARGGEVMPPVDQIVLEMVDVLERRTPWPVVVSRVG